MNASAVVAASAARDVVIDVNGLTKSFGGRVVVRDLSMQVKRGTIFGFLGPNGSGKTTTIRMLCGLLTPDEGSGTCLGFDIRTDAAKIKTRVGYMTQHFSLYQDLSVRENLEFVARIYGLPRPARAAKAMIARLGLDGREGQIAGKLSAAGSSGLRSAPVRCPTRSSCCSTSRPRASIPRRGAISGARSTTSRPAASPCSSPPITWMKPSAATRSRTSPSAACSRAAP
jgi:ABC transporter